MYLWSQIWFWMAFACKRIIFSFFLCTGPWKTWRSHLCIFWEPLTVNFNVDFILGIRLLICIPSDAFSKACFILKILKKRDQLCWQECLWKEIDLDLAHHSSSQRLASQICLKYQSLPFKRYRVQWASNKIKRIWNRMKIDTQGLHQGNKGWKGTSTHSNE